MVANGHCCILLLEQQSAVVPLSSRTAGAELHSQKLSVLLLIGLAAIAIVFAAAPRLGRHWSPADAYTTYASPGAIRVLDGDTVWFRGELLRLLTIDAPETRSARCEAEREAGHLASAQLSSLLADSLVEVRRSGRRDEFNRPLVRLFVDGDDAGNKLLLRGHATRYAWGRTYSKIYWCGLW